MSSSVAKRAANTRFRHPFRARAHVGDIFRGCAQVLDSQRVVLDTGDWLKHEKDPGPLFELYSFWTGFRCSWPPVWRRRGSPRARVSMRAYRFAAFGTIAIEGIGCVWGGLVADRRGRERLVVAAMALSGSCALVIPFAFGRSLWILGSIAWAWGFFVIADSAQFSALVTESVPPHAVGTALTVQTSLGFLLTMVSIQLVPPLVSLVDWKWVFPILAFGPAFGIAAIRRLAVARRALMLT